MTDWKDLVYRAVSEVLTHPKGGKVEVFVYPKGAGLRQITIRPFLIGVREVMNEPVDIDDLD